MYQYSINLMWLNHEKNLTEQYICHEAKFLEILQILEKWRRTNPEAKVNLWFDSLNVAEQAIDNTIRRLHNINIPGTNDIILKDLRSLEVVRNNQHVFSKFVPIYFQIDLLKLIICVAQIQMEQDDYAIFADLSIGVNSSEQELARTSLFAEEYLVKLKQTGILLGEQIFDDSDEEELDEIEAKNQAEQIKILLNQSWYDLPEEYEQVELAKDAIMMLEKTPENQYIQVANNPKALQALIHTINSALLQASIALKITFQDPTASLQNNVMFRLGEAVYNMTIKHTFKYLAGSECLDGIMVRSDWFDPTSEAPWIPYDPVKHNYVAFGHILDNDQLTEYCVNVDGENYNLIGKIQRNEIIKFKPECIRKAKLYCLNSIRIPGLASKSGSVHDHTQEFGSLALPTVAQIQDCKFYDNSSSSIKSTIDPIMFQQKLDLSRNPEQNLENSWCAELIGKTAPTISCGSVNKLL